MDNTPDNDQTPEWVTASVVAKAVGVSPKTVKRHAKAGLIVGQAPQYERDAWLIRLDSAEDHYGEKINQSVDLADPEPATLALLTEAHERERALQERLIELATSAAVSEQQNTHLRERLTEQREDSAARIEELRAEVERARRRWWRRSR